MCEIIVATGPVDEVAAEILRPFGHLFVPPRWDEVSVNPVLKDAIGLIVRGGSAVTGEMIRRAPRLKVIARSGAGYDSVDVKAATDRKIPVVYTPGVGARAVAEATVAFMLALVKRIPYWDHKLKRGDWHSRFDSRPKDLFGSTLGLVGFGQIGQLVARIVAPFEMAVFAYDPYVAVENASSFGVTLTSLEELMIRSDIISLHARLSSETHGLINRERLKLLKRGSYLINLARGALIESLDVLLEALKEERLAGVALDVFDPEPPNVSHPLFSLQNCLTSPHVLGTSEAAMHEIFLSMSRDMAAVFEGRRPTFVVNPEVFE